MRNTLVVDGYNIIGAWDELKKMKEKDLGGARDHLIELLADYQGYTDTNVVIVFDAYYVPGMESKQKSYNVDIIYTKKNETADECIEKLVSTYINANNQVYVATSDYMEQRIVFGRGALRKSARELQLELKAMKREIVEKIGLHKKQQPQSKILLNQDVLSVFEKLRRGR